MSLKGEVNKVSSEIGRAIQQLARSSVVGRDGAVEGTTKICGYVCMIHEDDELAGTIDVQEYGYLPGENDVKGIGHHEGVLLSAIQDNQNGFRIVPTLFSEVVIVRNPVDGMEYVLMYSHADRIELNAHRQVDISATEYADFVETDNGLEKDYDQLEPIGNKSSTTYLPESITSQVVSPDDENGFTEKTLATQKTLTVGDTTVTIDGQNVSIETSGTVTIKTDNAKIESSTCEVKGSTVTVTGGTLKVKGQSATDLQGPFNAIKVCPFSGAPHCGSSVSGT